MPPRQLGLLSFGVLIIVLAILLVAFFPRWDVILSLTVALYGLWVIVLAGIRAKNPVKYERGAFSTLIWGILLLAIGGAWFLYIQTLSVVYTLVLLLLVIGILAVSSALLRTRK